MKRIVNQWLEQSSYDFVTARAMHKTGRYLYVAFMCQQAIEKYLKALLCDATSKMPPYIHNLNTLAEHLGLKLNDSQLDFLSLLSSYYINARYPVIKQQLASSLNKRESSELLRKTGDFIQWLEKG